MFEERDNGPLAYVLAYDPRGKGQDVLDLLGVLQDIHGSLEIQSNESPTRRDYIEGPICICRVGPVILVLDQSANLMRMYAIPSPNQRGLIRDFPRVKRRLILTISHIKFRKQRTCSSLVSAGACLVGAIADLGLLNANPVCWHGVHLVEKRQSRKIAREAGSLYLGHGPSPAISATRCSSCQLFGEEEGFIFET